MFGGGGAMENSRRGEEVFIALPDEGPERKSGVEAWGNHDGSDLAWCNSTSLLTY